MAPSHGRVGLPQTAADFTGVEPWVWTASSCCAFVCFIIIPDRLKEAQHSYASLTATAVNCQYAVWSIQLVEWVHEVVQFFAEFFVAPQDFSQPLLGCITTMLCVATLCWLVWHLHAKIELEAREKHRRLRPDDYRRPIPLMPDWALMVLWMFCFCLLFIWVNAMHILMGQVYPACVCIGIFLMIFMP
eukprot:TRINITY_DN8277_c0_g1_i1.p1 TRINITY_DN8277_c0_g1~~TRINITY_DN8277_c0_g1_i1.p1  ORF type:complete len:210 (+),score=41.69 TRINITY_DN8277_c0_g1_i1:67-630(+)